MEMTYGGALVMPSSYAMMDEEEMMYLEGGISYSYKKGDDSGMKECYGSALTLAYLSGACNLVKQFTGVCSLMAGPVAKMLSLFSSVMQWASSYLALQFFVAGETARAIYKKSSYTITINTILGIPTTVICY